MRLDGGGQLFQNGVEIGDCTPALTGAVARPAEKQEGPDGVGIPKMCVFEYLERVFMARNAA